MTMHAVRWIFAFLLVGSSRANIPRSTIDHDAAEITDLNEELKSVSPPVFHRSQQLVCEMIDKCCSFIKPQLPSYVGDPITGSSKLMSACIGHHPHHTVLSRCPTLAKSVEIYQDQNFAKFVAAIRSALSEAQSVDVNVPLMCSPDEAYAVLCNGNNRPKVESCERKRLSHVAEHRTAKEYRAFVAELKKNLLLFIDEVKDAFPEIDTTKTTTARTTIALKTSSLLLPSHTEEIASTPLNSADRTMWKLSSFFTLLFALFFYFI